MITKTMLKEFRSDFKTMTMEQIEAKYDVTINLGNISYQPGKSFTSKIEVKQNEVNGESFEQNAWKNMCNRIGLEETDFNKVFTSNGNQFKLVEIKTRSSKYQVVAEELISGKRYKFTKTSVLNALRGER
ncbi:hypothetical protein [Clostridium sp.]|uniref:hypothetical protein n=1 Tax=Clostridium sp. TaxID=1506 RepID=UPI001A43B135|nr:hypothetical protein [Clostridium sp.]MBK5234099.1 hypothetical protein [Clostridium sp.]